MNKPDPILTILLIFFSSILSAQNVLDQNDVYPVDSLGSNRICFHKNMNLVSPLYHSQIVGSIKEGIENTSKLVEVTDVEFRVLVFPERTIPRIGMSGVAADKKHIYILLDPNHPKLYEAVTRHIVETIPHEYHHTLRNRNVGPNKNLFDALITEGLACHFAMEVCNIPPPKYCVAYSPEELGMWLEEAKKEFFNKEFDYYDWFVGRTKPRNIGYAIGYKIVADYMDKNPGTAASSLYSTPSSEFK